MAELGVRSAFDRGSTAGPFDVVILAGGGGRRLGGADKAGLLVAGVSLLDRVLTASAGARRTVVVGEPRPCVRPVYWAGEEPPGGGPLAGLGAGLAALDSLEENPLYPELFDPGRLDQGEGAGIVVVLAVDLPWLRASDLQRLLAGLAADPLADAALFVDAQGRTQPLTAAYRAGPIRAALAGLEPLTGKAVKLVLYGLAVVTVADFGAAADCDTPEELAAARADFDRQADPDQQAHFHQQAHFDGQG